MNILKKTIAEVSYPTGSKTFSVMQAFPAGIPAAEASPFLMCDHFGPTKEASEPPSNPDSFPIPWHPHRGMDICTYLRSGLGRHADSLGNRETYATPGLQWISVGSGIEVLHSYSNPSMPKEAERQRVGRVKAFRSG